MVVSGGLWARLDEVVERCITAGGGAGAIFHGDRIRQRVSFR